MAAETTNDRDKYVHLVLQGGGVKGIALVGALQVLEERGFRPHSVAGTSVGALIATLLVVGYTGDELHELILNLDFTEFEDRTWKHRIPLIESPLAMLHDLGMYQGEILRRKVATWLEAKGVRTFRDLVDPTHADDPQYRYKVQIIASDLTDHSVLVLPNDARKFGIEPDDLNVALALRMSMSMPFFFAPVRFRNIKTGEEHLIVDGGLLSNFPVWLFDCEGEPELPTFGLRLVEPELRTSFAARLPRLEPAHGMIEGNIRYLKSLVQTALEAHDRLALEQADYARTIAISNLGVQATDFHLSRERALALCDAGREAAERFLATWDFDRYATEHHCENSTAASRRLPALSAAIVDPRGV